MSWLQFVEWVVFCTLEPFGEVRADLRSAQVSMTVYNSQTVRRQDRKDLDAFLFKFDATKARNTKAPLTDAATWTSMKGWAKAQAGGVAESLEAARKEKRAVRKRRTPSE